MGNKSLLGPVGGPLCTGCPGIARHISRVLTPYPGQRSFSFLPPVVSISRFLRPWLHQHPSLPTSGLYSTYQAPSPRDEQEALSHFLWVHFLGMKARADFCKGQERTFPAHISSDSSGDTGEEHKQRTCNFQAGGLLRPPLANCWGRLGEPLGVFV